VPTTPVPATAPSSTAPSPLAARLRSLLPPLAAVAVAVAGAVLLWVGVHRTAAFGGDAPVSGRLPHVTQPVVVTVPGMSELAGGRLAVTATADGGRPVFIGVGRSPDVEAYLGGVARAEVTALEPGGTLRVAARAGEASLPDPAGVDVWAVASRGAGSATLTWPRVAGSWRVLIAVDGRTGPSTAELTWTGSAGGSPAPALIAVGAVLLVAGLAGLLAIRSGRVAARAVPSPVAPRPPAAPDRARSGRRAAAGPPDAVRSSGPPSGALPAPGRREVPAVPELPGDVPAPAVPELRETDLRETDLRETDLRDADADEEPVAVQPFRRRDRRRQEER